MRKVLFGFILLAVVTLTACQNGYIEDSYFCMDTVANIKIDSSDKNILNKCKQLLNSLDRQFSKHNENGFTYKYNISENGIELSKDIKSLIIFAERITKETDGAFTVFAGGLTTLWEESVKYPDEAMIKNALASIQNNVSFEGDALKKENPNTKLEFGGIAKGYACDMVMEFLKESGVRSGIVSFSSSVGVFGTNARGEEWRIAIKNPTDNAKIIGYIALKSGGLSVSGDYERFYEIDGVKYNHIIDTKTGLPVDNGVHSVVVVSDSCAECDALSTAFFVMGIDEVNKKYADSDEIKYLFVTDDGIFMNDSMRVIFSEK